MAICHPVGTIMKKDDDDHDHDDGDESGGDVRW